MSNDVLLEIKGLKTHFHLDEGVVRAVDGVDFSVKRGSTIGIVGESGCGKSVTAFSILQLVTPPGQIAAGEVLFHRQENNSSSTQSDTLSSTINVVDLAALDSHSEELRSIRGKEIAMIFQEPMSSLSMMHTIGFQIMEAILLHFDVSQGEARDRAIEMLRLVGIPKPEQRVDDYPFQLSGGMRQRAMIAMALSCNPSLLIADEPTTALDVTTQAQILELMASLQKEFGMAVMMITHDLGVVAEICDEVVVMYLGEIVDRLGQSRHGRLDPIEGTVPDPYNRPSGCPFHPRCDKVIPGRCDQIRPELQVQADGRAVRCLLYETADNG